LEEKILFCEVIILQISKLKNMFRYAMLCLFLIFFSCEKDEPVDSTPPTISFVSPTSSGAVWNTVKIVLDVQDIALVDVEILIDNVSLATLTALPFEIDWDTQSLPDGTHTIKAIAKDKSGNVTNAEIQVTVKNVLLTIDDLCGGKKWRLH
jgi:hypothetical protein